MRSVSRSLSSTVLGLAVAVALTVTPAGCSCVEPPGVFRLAVADDGALLAGITDESDAGSWRWARSTDTGRTWRAIDQDEARAALEDPSAVASTETCSPSAARCWRAVPGQRVDERIAGGEWSPTFAFTATEIERLRRHQISCAQADGASDAFTVVTVVDGIAVVAMGTQGVLRRDDATGWQRIGVLDVEPIDLTDPGIGLWWQAVRAVLTAAPVLLAATLLARDRPPRAQVVILAAGGAVAVAAAVAVAPASAIGDAVIVGAGSLAFLAVLLMGGRAARV